MRSIGFKSVRTKILAAFLVTVIGMIGAGGFTLLKLRDTYHLVDQAKTRQLRPTQHARALVYDVTSSTTALNTATTYVFRPNTLAIAKQSLEASLGLLLSARADAAQLKNDHLDASVRPLTATYLTNFAALDKTMYPMMSASIEQFSQLVANAGKDPKGTAALTKLFADLSSSGTALIAGLDRAAISDQKKAHDLYLNGVRAATVMLVIAILLAIALGLIVAQSIRRPLRQAVAVLEEVANGDLTQRLDVQSADEVGQMAIALNSSLATVHDVIQQIESDASKLSTLAGTQSAGSGAAAGSVSELAELAEMAENLNAMISVFHTESVST